ncbi:hypothetical protein Glove_79g102 [Diversispora epigaea]|uniref:Protein kinase domain-containing protein n=1 Tax=Diversispora epigaea TaxID=1348612 RepID=A0A397JBY8_9GLOM|nr:hypothetical protein Glove_79g102 [Diversispora epigaea]
MEQNTITSNLNDYGICEECGNENTDDDWCLQCNSQRLQQNFGNWTSGNKDVDTIIQEMLWKSIFSYLEGGTYSKVEYSAKQMEKIYKKEVALKSLNNSQNITTEFLNEVDYSIHKKNLIHRNFDIGNILSLNNEKCLIIDLGLSKQADETGISKDNKQKVFGIIPYIAPEVLSGDDNYSKASDIYGFAMIMFEISTGIPPFYDIPHDKDLALKICNGYRPKIPSNIAIPQLLNKGQLSLNWQMILIITGIKDEVKESEIYKQFEECNRLNLTNPVDNDNTNSSTSYEIHSSVEPKNLNENNDKNTNESKFEDNVEDIVGVVIVVVGDMNDYFDRSVVEEID